MTLKHTLDEARQRFVAKIGTKGNTEPRTNNDCLAFALERLGVRQPGQVTPEHFVSISAFRSWAGWDQIAIEDVIAGDLICEEWPDAGKQFTGLPGHIEYAYSPVADKITIISANTGPIPGTPTPRGVWKKDRERTKNLLFGIRPPYKDDVPSKARATEVRVVAAYVNDDAVLHSTLPHTAAQQDGIEGPLYWKRVQTWGHLHNLYGQGYIIDGIPGPRSRAVEAAIYAAAKKAAKA